MILKEDILVEENLQNVKIEIINLDQPFPVFKLIELAKK